MKTKGQPCEIVKGSSLSVHAHSPVSNAFKILSVTFSERCSTAGINPCGGGGESSSEGTFVLGPFDDGEGGEDEIMVHIAGSVREESWLRERTLDRPGMMGG